MKVMQKRSLSVVFGLLSLMMFSCNNENLNFREEFHVVSFDELGEKIYFKSKKWGISWDHEETILSNLTIDKDFKVDKNRDFVFYTSDLFYKKVGKDSLFVYVNYSSIPQTLPSSFSSNINVKIVELKTKEEVSDYDLNYLKFGLTRIHVPTKTASEK